MLMDKIKIKYIDKDAIPGIFEINTGHSYNVWNIKNVFNATTVAIQYSSRYKRLTNKIYHNSKENCSGKIILDQSKYQTVECDFYYYESICIICLYKFNGNQISINKLQEKMNCPLFNFKDSNEIEEFLNEVKKVKLIV